MRRGLDRILLLSLAAVAASCRPNCDRRTTSHRLVIAPAPAQAVRSTPPASNLPAGCEQISYGANSRLSADGTFLSVVRWVFFGGRYAQGDREMGLGAEPALAEPWILDLRTREEWRLPRPRPPRPDVPNVNASMERRPMAWRGEDALLLADGSVVDPRRGEDVLSGVLPPPAADVRSVAWSPDGRRLACAVGPSGDRRVVVVESDGRARQVDLPGAHVGPRSLRLRSVMGSVPDSGATSPESRRLDGVSFRWSPTGRHAYFVAQVHVRFGPEMTWVGVLLPDGSVKVLHEVQGFTQVTIDGGASAWDGSGAWFAWTRVLSRENADVYVSKSDGSESIRVTDDGVAKWSATLDPSTRRVAFYVGDLDRNGYPSRMRIRVLDLLTGRSLELPLALPDARAHGLTWTPDGHRLLYEAYGEERHGVFAQTVAPPPPVADGTPILRKPDPDSPVR